MLTTNTRKLTPTDVDVVIIGAGFGGLYALHALRERGFTTAAFEAGTSVGGTWFWNRYPGARCDVESLSVVFPVEVPPATRITTLAACRVFLSDG